MKGLLLLLMVMQLQVCTAAGFCNRHMTLSAPWNAPQALEGVEGEHVVLQPGEVTLHHIRLAHRSGPAQAGSPPRLGLALRYMAAHVQQGLDPRDSVTLVAGRDSFGHYRHERAPAGELVAVAWQQHAAAVVAVYPPGFKRGQ